MDKGAANEKDEPKFFPGWLKATSNVGLTGGANSIHHLDEHGGGLSAKIRSSSRSFGKDDMRSSSRSLTSFPRSSSINGCFSHDKDGSGYSRLQSNSGKGYRGRDSEPRSRDRNRTVFLGSFDSSIVSRNEKDTLRRSQTTIPRMRCESFPKISGHGIANGRGAGTDVDNRREASFEKEFPSLGVDEKQRPSEVARISSLGLVNAVPSLPIGTSPVIADGGWSALAEVPSGFSVGGPKFSSGLPTVPSTPTPPSPTSTPSGLNMAETVAQAPLRVCNAPQLSFENQKIEELNRRQCVKLIPVTPSMPKILGCHFTEKSKFKGTRGDLAAAPMALQLAPAQVVAHATRPTVVSDAPKPSPSGNFQLLIWERNGISPSTKDGQNTYNMVARTVNPAIVVPPPAAGPTRNSVDRMFKAECKGRALPSVLGSFGEKKSASVAKDRNEFFNAIRKKSCSNLVSGVDQLVTTTSPDKTGETMSETCGSANAEKVSSLSSDPISDLLVENGDCGSSEESVTCCALESGEEGGQSSDIDIVDPEEKAFLESLGWNEHGEAAVLTATEVAEFMEENRERMPSSKLSHLQRITFNAFGLNSLSIGR